MKSQAKKTTIKSRVAAHAAVPTDDRAETSTIPAREIGAAARAEPRYTYRIIHRTFADRHGRFYELRRYGKSHSGMAIASRWVRHGEPLSAHRQARRELQEEIEELEGSK